LPGAYGCAAQWPRHAGVMPGRLRSYQPTTISLGVRSSSRTHFRSPHLVNKLPGGLLKHLGNGTYQLAKINSCLVSTIFFCFVFFLFFVFFFFAGFRHFVAHLLTAICCSYPSTRITNFNPDHVSSIRRLSRLPAHTLSQLCAQYLPSDQLGVRCLSFGHPIHSMPSEPRQHRARAKSFCNSANWQ